MIHGVTVDVGTRTPSFETELLEPFVTINKGTAPLFMERLMAAHQVKKANEHMAGTVVEDHSVTTEYKSQPLSRSVIKPPFDMRSEIERTMPTLVS